jgi:hypothetical protein
MPVISLIWTTLRAIAHALKMYHDVEGARDLQRIARHEVASRHHDEFDARQRVASLVA